MNTANVALSPYAQSFRTLESARTAATPDWLAHLRRQAFACFTAQGFPAERNEDWKYTSTRTLEKRGFIPADSARATVPTDVIEMGCLREATGPALVFVNGRYAPELSRTTPALPGTRITNLGTALEQDAERWKAMLLPESAWAHDTFTALNTAFLADGAVVEIADGTVPGSPLQLLFISTFQPQALACHPRVIVKLGANAQMTLVETYLGIESAANFTNSYTQIHLGDNARLEHLRLQRESDQDFHVSRVYVSQQRDSRYSTHTLNFGGYWIRNDLWAQLEAPGAYASLNGLYLADLHRHVDNHTRIDHLAPHTRSEELYRGIINGRGRAVFNGKVVVAKHAVKTDASQTNNNLLLSRHGEIDTKPELEIYADDVKCSHGASIGQFDEQALFYLRSRGLDLETARGMLIGAFASAVLRRLTLAELRAFASLHLASVLPQAAALEHP